MQKESFKDEYQALLNQKELPKHSKILVLNPKLDVDGLIRCDSRLKNAEYLAYDTKFPILLSRKHRITKLIVRKFHNDGNHVAGTNHTLSNLSSKYWITSAREVIREVEKECNFCLRRKAKVATQIMAPLPKCRLEVTLRAFDNTAVDFGGPYITIQGRGKRREKRYLCLFTCLTTRAVHLEMAYGLDTGSFLNAFSRMVSRRGVPRTMVSDNGTNFVSANKELQSLVNNLDLDRIYSSTAHQGVNWKFNPPQAPHFGGVFEVMIKIAKKAISVVLGNADITDEELCTAIIGVEAFINSRPLTYQSSNPNDNTVLTPNHFLHGQVGGTFAPEIDSKSMHNPKFRWRRVQELIRHVWKRWINEWLPNISARKKWITTHKNLQVGDIVIVADKNIPKAQWKLGRILEVFPGKDGQVRVAKVQMGDHAYIRPIQKLCPLPLLDC